MVKCHRCKKQFDSYKISLIRNKYKFCDLCFATWYEILRLHAKDKISNFISKYPKSKISKVNDPILNEKNESKPKNCDRCKQKISLINLNIVLDYFEFCNYCVEEWFNEVSKIAAKKIRNFISQYDEENQAREKNLDEILEISQKMGLYE